MATKRKNKANGAASAAQATEQPDVSFPEGVETPDQRAKYTAWKKEQTRLEKARNAFLNTLPVATDEQAADCYKAADNESAKPELKNQAYVLADFQKKVESEHKTKRRAYCNSKAGRLAARKACVGKKLVSFRQTLSSTAETVKLTYRKDIAKKKTASTAS